MEYCKEFEVHSQYVRSSHLKKIVETSLQARNIDTTLDSNTVSSISSWYLFSTFLQSAKSSLTSFCLALPASLHLLQTIPYPLSFSWNTGLLSYRQNLQNNSFISLTICCEPSRLDNLSKFWRNSRNQYHSIFLICCFCTVYSDRRDIRTLFVQEALYLYYLLVLKLFLTSFCV